MAKPQTLDELVAEMRTVGEQLIPYNYPNSERGLEAYMNGVKVKEFMVDGYSLILHYSKADYKDHYTEIVQMYGKNIPFLPFNMVIKIGIKFLGSHNLLLTEQINDGQKIYCWTVVLDKKGKPIAHNRYSAQAEALEYEGFKYGLLNANQVSTY